MISPRLELVFHTGREHHNDVACRECNLFSVPGSEQCPLYDSARFWAASVMNIINRCQSQTLNERQAILWHHKTLDISYDVGVVGMHAIDLLSLHYAQGQI